MSRPPAEITNDALTRVLEQVSDMVASLRDAEAGRQAPIIAAKVALAAEGAVAMSRAGMRRHLAKTAALAILAMAAIDAETEG